MFAVAIIAAAAAALGVTTVAGVALVAVTDSSC